MGQNTAVCFANICMTVEKKERRSKQMLLILGERTCKTHEWP